MSDQTLYIQLKQNIETLEDEILLGDAASLYCENPAIKAKANAMKIHKFRKDENRAVIGILTVIEKLTQMSPGLTVESIGENDIVVERIKVTKHKGITVCLKIIFVTMIAFFGTGFTIMAYHNDIGISDVFKRIYEIITGQKSNGCTILEIAYSVGLSVGIIIFYNHIGGRRITKDPTPIEIEMRNYERDVNQTLIETAQREGKEIDAN